MKRTAILVVVLLCACALFAGCDKQAKAKKELGDALLGHWQNKSGDSIYFSPHEITVVTAGNTYKTTYRVVGADTEVNDVWMKIGKVVEDDKFAITSEKISFELGEDRNTLNTVSAMTFISLDSDFNKVDDKQSP